MKFPASTHLNNHWMLVCCFSPYCRNLWCRSRVCGMDQRDRAIFSLGSLILKHLTTYWSYLPVIHLFESNLILCLGLSNPTSFFPLFVCKLWSPYLLGSGPKDTGTTATTVMAWSSVLAKTATAMFIEWHCPHSNLSCSMYVSIVFQPTPNSLVLYSWRTVFLSECYTVIIWYILCRQRSQHMYHKSSLNFVTIKSFIMESTELGVRIS